MMGGAGSRVTAAAAGPELDPDCITSSMATDPTTVALATTATSGQVMRRGSGRPAGAVACGSAGTASPAAFNTGSRKSRRRANSLLRSSSTFRDSGEKAAQAACCAAAGAEMKRCCASFSNPRTAVGGSTTQPSRQPVMQKYFEKLLMITTSPGKSSAVHGSAP